MYNEMAGLKNEQNSFSTSKPSIYTLKNRGDSNPPWRTPLLTVNISEQAVCDTSILRSIPIN